MPDFIANHNPDLVLCFPNGEDPISWETLHSIVNGTRPVFYATHTELLIIGWKVLGKRFLPVVIPPNELHAEVVEEDELDSFTWRGLNLKAAQIMVRPK